MGTKIELTIGPARKWPYGGIAAGSGSAEDRQGNYVGSENCLDGCKRCVGVGEVGVETSEGEVSVLFSGRRNLTDGPRVTAPGAFIDNIDGRHVSTWIGGVVSGLPPLERLAVNPQTGEPLVSETFACPVGRVGIKYLE